jgi:adenylate cyclase
MGRKKALVIGECLGLAAVIAVLLYATSILDWLDVKASDVVYKARGAPPPSPDVIIVSADRASEAELGEFGPAWRGHHGRIVDMISQGGARAIGFDLCFEEATEHDLDFAESIRRARERGTAVVVGAGCSPDEDKMIPPTEPIGSHVSGWGKVSLLMKEGAVRKARVITQDGEDGLAPSFDLLVVTAGRANKGHIDLRGGKVASPLLVFSPIPVDSKGYMFINFAREGSRFRRYSYVDVLKGDIPSEVFKDGIVLIGGEIEKLGKRLDYFSTPVGGMYGVEVHANAINAIRQGVPVRSLDNFIINALIVVALGIIALLLSVRFSIWGGIALTVLEGVIFVGVSLILMRSGLMVGIVYPLTIMFLSSGGATLYHYIMAREEVAQAQGLRPEVIRRLKRDKGLKKGLRKMVTVLFSDIRGSTEFTRESSMEHAHGVVSEYRKVMEEIVYRNGGYVMKYMGDGIMAVFGYPLDSEDHSKKALKCAVEMRRASEELLEKWDREGVRSFRGTGIGIDTGDVIFSMVGGGRRVQFDIMGDAANYAARLESLTKDYTHSLLISEETYREVRVIVKVSPGGVLEKVPVKGLGEKTIYKIDGLMEDAATQGDRSI